MNTIMLVCIPFFVDSLITYKHYFKCEFVSVLVVLWINIFMKLWLGSLIVTSISFKLFTYYKTVKQGSVVSFLRYRNSMLRGENGKYITFALSPQSG